MANINKPNKILSGGESQKSRELINPIEFYKSKEECAKAIILHGLSGNTPESIPKYQELIDPIEYDIPTKIPKKSSITTDITNSNQGDFSEDSIGSGTELHIAELFVSNGKKDNAETIAEDKRIPVDISLQSKEEDMQTETPNIQHLEQTPADNIGFYPKPPEPESLPDKPTSVRHKDRTTPYDTAQKFIRLVCVIIISLKLYVYNGRYYEYCSRENVKPLLAEKCRVDYAKVGEPRFLNAVYEAIMAESSLVKNPEEINRRFCSFQNGALDLNTRLLLEHSPMYFITYGIQCNYEYGKCPNFERFISTAMYGNAGLIERVYQMIGYILSPDMNGKVFFLLQGCSGSGKSVLSDLLRSFFNREAVMPLDVHELSDRFAPSNLEGKVLCVSPDLPSGALDVKAVSKLKQLTGNDWISADVKYQDRVEFCCRAKFVLVTNHPFVTRQSDEAFMERVVAIPFLYAVPKEQQDPALLDKLKTERSAIAFKAMQAYYKLVQNKYRFAGSYQPNTAPVLYTQNSGNMTDLSSAIYGFAMNYLEADKEGIVFMEDTLKVFMKQYGIEITAQAFSSRFEDAVGQLFHAPKARKRKSGELNPKSCFTGIRFKQH